MKLKCVTLGLLMLVAAVMRLSAQQSETAQKHFEATKTKAQNGDVVAQFQLGIIYESGQGVAQDEVQAVKWYREAAQQNYAKAQYALGFCYEAGEGVAQDYREALQWYRKAADQGDAPAQCNLGAMYARGHGIPEDHVEAAKWYRKAADQGNQVAQSNLGAMYADGVFVTKDYGEAVKLFRKAADQGSAEAEFNLGLTYESGHGLPEDHVEAVKWYRKAAEQGNKAAQYNLSVAYFNGDGLSRNYMEAYKWDLLAAAQGDETARKNLAIDEKLLTQEQVAEAQKEASAFVPRKETPVALSNDPISLLNPTGTGSGFFITDDGYLISNYHVVKDAATVRLLTDAGLFAAKVVRVDAATDLALLKAEGRFASLPITSSRAVKFGGAVASVGFPDIGLQGFAPKFARGEIASLSGAADDARYFQISVPVQPGNSGGALLDDHGNVVGVVSAKLNASVALAATGALPENVNYAMKSSFLLGFLESMPEVSAKLKKPISAVRKFDDVAQSAQSAAVLVLVY